MPDFIFVGGMPRSGTSLIGQLTSQAEGISGTVTDNSVINYLGKYNKSPFNIPKEKLESIVEDFNTKTSIKRWNLSTAEILKESEEFPINNWYDLTICYLIAVKKKRGQTIYVKSPGLEFYFSVINTLLPNQYTRKFVYVLRNPLNSYKSMKYAGLAWRGKQSKISDQSIRWALKWKDSIDRYFFNIQNLKENIILLKHEDVVSNREKTFRKYFDYLGIELTKKVLDHENVRQSSIAGHENIKRVLTETEKENIEKICLEKMVFFNYANAKDYMSFYNDYMKRDIDHFSTKEKVLFTLKSFINK